MLIFSIKLNQNEKTFLNSIKTLKKATVSQFKSVKKKKNSDRNVFLSV